MGKFAPKRLVNYNFVSLEELVYDVMQEFKEGQIVTIALTVDEVPDYLTAFLSTGKIKPYDIDWAYPEINGYSGEYYFTLTHLNDGDDVLFVGRAYDSDKCRYISECPDVTNIMFVSVEVSKILYNKCVNDGHNVVLFDIEK